MRVRCSLDRMWLRLPRAVELAKRLGEERNALRRVGGAGLRAQRGAHPLFLRRYRPLYLISTSM